MRGCSGMLGDAAGCEDAAGAQRGRGSPRGMEAEPASPRSIAPRGAAGARRRRWPGSAACCRLSELGKAPIGRSGARAAAPGSAEPPPLPVLSVRGPRLRGVRGRSRHRGAPGAVESPSGLAPIIKVLCRRRSGSFSFVCSSKAMLRSPGAPSVSPSAPFLACCSWV